MTTYAYTSQRAPVMVNGRGDMGRTPVYNRTDLLVAYEWKPKFFGEGRALRFEFNAQRIHAGLTRLALFHYPKPALSGQLHGVDEIDPVFNRAA